MKCILCRGTGAIPEPINSNIRKKKSIARRLVDAGFTLRETAELMGYKHIGSVQYLLNDAPNTKTATE